MDNEELVSFLQPDINQVKHSIRDIDDSYNNEWDILAELIQNSVDAIRLTNKGHGQIDIIVDAVVKIIEIRDDGIGIEKELLPHLLRPFSGDKMDQTGTIGEKGVGLTFTMFSCNDFYIKTGTEKGSCEATVMNAYTWKQNDGTEDLKLKKQDLNDGFRGTQIRLKNIENCSLFDLTIEQMIFVLRSKTAIGNTKTIWDSDIDIEIKLQMVDTNHEHHSVTVPFSYYLPDEGINQREKIDLDEFRKYTQSEDRTDADKRRKLKDKIVYKKGIFNHNDNRTIRYIAYFMPSRRAWEQLSIKNKLLPTPKQEDEEYKNTFHYCFLSEGIMTSVKGMPTGIAISPPSSGAAGYWSNFFIIFEDPQLKFDIGRKSLHGRQAKILRDYSREIFTEFLKYIRKYVSGEIKTDPIWDKEGVFFEIEKLPKLNNTKTRFVYSPKNQEASVAGIFFELMGKEIITDITPLVAGYKNKYDLYAKVDNRNKVIEFKSHLSNILKDFDDEKKLFDEVDIIIAWDVNEDDETQFHLKGITLAKCEPGIFSSPSLVKQATHTLDLSGYTNPIYVIDLKRVIEN